jgi:hypothetical protein
LLVGLISIPLLILRRGLFPLSGRPFVPTCILALDCVVWIIANALTTLFDLSPDLQQLLFFSCLFLIALTFVARFVVIYYHFLRSAESAIQRQRTVMADLPRSWKYRPSVSNQVHPLTNLSSDPTQSLNMGTESQYFRPRRVSTMAVTKVFRWYRKRFTRGEWMLALILLVIYVVGFFGMNIYVWTTEVSDEW